MNRRAAVIIGVSTSANLQKLDSAAPNAHTIGQWLETLDPAYDVTVITDENGPVTRGQIFQALDALLTPTRYELLLVYYIGHGLYHNRSDVWMLSNLPKDPAECVNFDASRDDAKFCGIKNVIFISDACRSLPDTISLAKIQPSTVFPYLSQFTKATGKIDYFCATAEGFPAFEGEIDGERHSYLTYALRSAFKAPHSDMLKDLQLGGRSISVVPNRLLEEFIQETINEKLGEKDFNKTQWIEANVPSTDDVFIAPVDPSYASTAFEVAIKTPSGDDDFEIATTVEMRTPKDILRSTFSNRSPSADLPLSDSLKKELQPHMPDSRVTSFETGTGFTLLGAKIIRAEATKHPIFGTGVEIADDKVQDLELGVIRIFPSLPAAEIAIELDDGRCLLLPVLKGYIGHILIDSKGMTALSFVPSEYNWRFDAYVERKVEIDQLRAAATLALDQRQFNVGDVAKAKGLASAIRIGKAIDPVLGLYAAYGYSEAGEDNEIIDLSHYMQNDIGGDLFDVRLLSYRHWTTESLPPVVPRCPLLTQGWNLLESRKAALPGALLRCQPYLADSLWTTFKPGASEILFEAIFKGEL